MLANGKESLENGNHDVVDKTEKKKKGKRASKKAKEKAKLGEAKDKKVKVGNLCCVFMLILL